jgi:hypothetical protein
MENGQNNDKTNLAPPELGYLVVRVSTALGSIPLENATVHIRGNTADSSGVLYSLLSDRDGLTKKVALPAPPRALSGAPGTVLPFSTWNIDVTKEGYIPVSFQNVPVYSQVVSVQPAVLVPRTERLEREEIYNESIQPDL